MATTDVESYWIEGLAYKLGGTVHEVVLKEDYDKLWKAAVLALTAYQPYITGYIRAELELTKALEELNG